MITGAQVKANLPGPRQGLRGTVVATGTLGRGHFARVQWDDGGTGHEAPGYCYSGGRLVTLNNIIEV